MARKRKPRDADTIIAAAVQKVKADKAFESEALGNVIDANKRLRAMVGVLEAERNALKRDGAVLVRLGYPGCCRRTVEDDRSRRDS